MKKQIFILIMALFAVTTVFGQITVKNSDIKVWAQPTCAGDASKPAAGEEYTYTVKIPVATETDYYAGYNGDGIYDWYVTQDVNLLNLTSTDFKTPGTEFTVAASGSSTYHSNTGTSADIKITWTAAAIATAKPYYLVVRYTEVNTNGTLASCSSSNIKVYQIDPQNTFWLDIDPATSAGAVPTDATMSAVGYTYDICAADVKTAVVTPGATPSVSYTFNDNILYAVIHAAGYTGDWVPSLKISGLVDDQAVSGITWTAGAKNGTFTCAAPTFGNGTYTSATALPSTNAGTDILLAITINNNHHEALTDQGVKISIDGSYTAGGVTYNDKSDAKGGCSDEDPDSDFVVQTIKARPAIHPITPASFINDSTHKN